MIKTRLTDQFNLTCPIIQAPMAFAAGGMLASAVSQFGGMGLIGGGYGDADWIHEQFDLAGDAPVGCGFITWSLRKQPELLDQVIARSPSAIFLSFGNPTQVAKVIKAANIPLICQIQSTKDAHCALEAGADIIVAQGSEAGGHGELRATMTLVPEVADLISSVSPQTLLCAAGGIADGRGLAAALMLGADGVLIGSRLWASNEAIVHQNMHQEALSADGDKTIRSSVMDIARLLEWPKRYTARVIKNGFTEQWHDNIDQLKSVSEIESSKWKQAWQEGNTNIANTFVGEAAGLIHEIRPASEILSDMLVEAEALLHRQWT